MPRIAAIGGLVNPISGGEIGTYIALSSPDINHFRIRRSDSQRPNRGHRLLIEDWLPCGARVRGLPDSAIDGTKVEGRAIARNSTDRNHAAGAKRSNQAPFHITVHLRRDGLGHCRQRGQQANQSSRKEWRQSTAWASHITLRLSRVHFCGQSWCAYESRLVLNPHRRFPAWNRASRQRPTRADGPPEAGDSSPGSMCS